MRAYHLFNQGMLMFRGPPRPTSYCSVGKQCSEGVEADGMLSVNPVLWLTCTHTYIRAARMGGTLVRARLVRVNRQFRRSL